MKFQKRSISPEDLQIWEAEDGRCEVCGRPTDRRAAIVRGARLWCPLCADDLPEPFSRGLSVRSGPARKIKSSDVGPLCLALATFGVVLAYEERGNFALIWLPGVGRFLVNFPRRRPAVLNHAHLYPKPEIRIRRQERTRGLPAPTLEEGAPVN